MKSGSFPSLRLQRLLHAFVLLSFLFSPLQSIAAHAPPPGPPVPAQPAMPNPSTDSGQATGLYRTTVTLRTPADLTRLEELGVVVLEERAAQHGRAGGLVMAQAQAKPWLVASLRTALARWAHEVEIVGVAGSADQAAALAKTLRPDIVLLDLRISENPDAEAADARHGLRALLDLRQMTEVRTVVMSFTRDPAWLRAVSETGAWAFWDKDQDVATLVGLLRRVVAGERLLTAEQWAEVGEEQLVEQLSPREWEVLLCLKQGLSNQEIAGRLGISVRTVEKHVQNVRGKLGARSRSEAVAKARELGLLGGGRPDFPPPPDSGV